MLTRPLLFMPCLYVFVDMTSTYSYIVKSIYKSKCLIILALGKSFSLNSSLCWLCVSVSYLRGLVGPPAVLVAVQAGQQHVLVSVHLTEAQRFMRVVTDHIVAVKRLLCVCVPILHQNKHKQKNLVKREISPKALYFF